MHIQATFPTMYGPRAIPRRPMIRVTITPAELHSLIRTIEREATEAERDGHVAAADVLFWRAAALREAGR